MHFFKSNTISVLKKVALSLVALVLLLIIGRNTTALPGSLSNDCGTNHVNYIESVAIGVVALQPVYPLACALPSLEIRPVHNDRIVLLAIFSVAVLQDSTPSFCHTKSRLLSVSLTGIDIVFPGTLKKGVRIVYEDFAKVFIGITISISCMLALKYSGLI